MHEQDKAILAAKMWLQELKKDKTKKDEAVILEKLIEMADNKVVTPFGTLRISDEAKFYGVPSISILLETKDTSEETVATVSYEEDDKQIVVEAWRPNSLDIFNKVTTHTDELCRERDNILLEHRARGIEWK